MSTRLTRPATDSHIPQFARYIARVPDGDIVESLRTQIDDTSAMLRAAPAALADHAYAPGKWTAKEVVGHITDVERVMSYRALRFARGDATPLAGFEVNDYVPAGEFAARTLVDLIDELRVVRAATVALFAALPETAWTHGGVARGNRFTVASLAWVIAGHELHHRHLLETLYLSPAPNA